MSNSLNALQKFIKERPFGFITDKEIPTLLAMARLTPLLVRCGGCRFTCAVQYLEHMEKCIKAGGDYVRDVSFPVGSVEAAAYWKPEPALEPARVSREPLPTPQPHNTAHIRHSDIFESTPSDADGGL